MAEDLERQLRLSAPVSRLTVIVRAASIPLLAYDYIKDHIRRHDLDPGLIKPLVLRSIDTRLKVHPFMEIVVVPASLRIPAGIFPHGDLIADHGLIVFLLLCHGTVQSILIGCGRAVIMDLNGVSAPGDLI